MTDYVWTRRDDESDPAWRAFKLYLDAGSQRSIRKVADREKKSHQLIAGWSSQHEWVERCRAFDRHLQEAQTDGLVNQMAETRDKNLALMDKLREHLSRRLDTFIRLDQDPSVRWTQALMAMAKVEANSLVLGAQDKTSDSVARVEQLVARLEQEMDAP
jgi:hypothetical protein